MHPYPRISPWAIGLLTATVLLSCAQNVTLPTASEVLPKLGTLISALPNIAAALPKSLQDGAKSATSANLRAVGDVTTLDPASVAGVRSQGYVSVKETLSSSSVASMLKVLKAGIAGKDIPLNTDVRLGTVTLPDGVTGPDGSAKMDLGIIRASKSGSVTQVKWMINITMPMPSATGGATQSVTAPMYIYLELEGATEATLKAKYTVQCDLSADFSMNVVGSFDATTGKTSEIYPGTATMPAQYSQFTNQGGVAKYFMITRPVPGTSILGSMSLAYATDTMGGVIYKYPDPEGNQSVYSEYYNGSGDLVQSVYGNSADLSAAKAYLASGYNLRSIAPVKPESVQVKQTYTTVASNTTTVYQISVDDGTTWKSLNAADYEGKPLLWIAGSEPAAGDALYFYSSNTSDSTWDEATQTSTYVITITYQVGFSIPSPQSYLGGDFYASTTFPLKYLRPSSGLPLKQKEGQTQTVSFQDKDGGQHTYSYTNNQFWLENIKWRNKAGDNDNSELTNDAEKGDILQDQLRVQEFYNWDETGQAYTKTAAYVLTTTEPSPVGWTFSTDAQAVVAGVKDNVTALYSQIPTNLTSDFKTEADAIVKMPETKTFPTY